MEDLAQHYAGALDDLVATLRADRTILAAILCGSLSHDAVWARSDIDLLLITIDDKKAADRSFLGLNSRDVNVHACICTRGDFRKMVDGALRNSFQHSMLAKSRLLYTHDETIPAMLESLHQIGERDTQLQLLAAGIEALLPMDKAHKWFLTRGDLNYAALWILYAATPLAKIEILKARRLVDREVMPHAMELNPEFFRIVYTDLLNTKKTVKNVKAALDDMDAYFASHARQIFQPVIAHLAEVGEARSATEIDSYFARAYGLSCVSAACEYLSELKVLAKVSTPVQLTRRSNVSLQEMAFFLLEASPD